MAPSTHAQHAKVQGCTTKISAQVMLIPQRMTWKGIFHLFNRGKLECITCIEDKYSFSDNGLNKSNEKLPISSMQYFTQCS